MCRQCVDAYSSAVSRLIAVVNAVWILPVFYAPIASRSPRIGCINIEWQPLVEADVAIAATTKLGKRIIVVRIIW